MCLRTNGVIIFSVFLVIFLVSPLMSQMKNISSFTGVKIPYNLKHEDTTIEKGEYDIEILISEVPSGQMFFLAIKHKGNRLCLLPGEELQYDTIMPKEQLKDPDIPDDPRIEMKRHPITKMFYMIWESGKKAWFYPLRIVRFKIQSEE